MPSEHAPDEAPCVYCGQFVMPPINADHAADCPSGTGIFPVIPQDIEPHGMRCSGCGKLFALGDRYVERTLVPQTGEGLAGASVVEPLCFEECGYDYLLVMDAMQRDDGTRKSLEDVKRELGLSDDSRSAGESTDA